MVTNEEARIELTLVAQKYLAGIKNVEGQTEKSEKAMEKAFTRLSRDAEGASAKYSLLGNKSQKLAQDQKALERAIDTLIKNGFSKTSPQVQALIADYRNLGTATNVVEPKVNKIKDSLLNMAKGLTAGYLGIQGVKKAAQYIGESVVEFVDAEKAYNRLNAAFIASGDSSGVASRAIQKMAEQLQSLTNVSEEEIQTAGGLLRSIGKLDRDGIEQILPKIIDMSKALDISLETAAQQVAQTLAGGRNTLIRYGIEVDKNASLSEKLASITDQLNSKFGGTAKELANVIDGIKLEASELKEAIGGALMFRFDTLAGYYKDGIKVIADSIKSATHETQFNSIFDALMGGASFDSVDRELKGIGDTWVNVLAKLYGKQADLQDRMNNANSPNFAPTAQTRKELEAVNKKIEAVNAYSVAQAKSIEYYARQKAAEDAAREKSEKLAAQEQAEIAARVVSYGDWESAADRVVDVTGALAASQKLDEEAIKQAAEEYKNAADSMRLLTDAEIERIALNGADDFLGFLDTLPTVTDNVEDATEALNEYNRELMRANSNHAESEKMTLDLAGAWDAASGALDAYSEYQSNQADAEIAALEKSGASEEQIAAKRNEIRKREFNNQKAMKLAEAIINTATEVSKNLANPVLAAITGAAGAVQVGLIAAQNYVPMAEGGIVKGGRGGIIAQIGEKSYDEAVIPLKKNAAIGGVTQYFYIGGSVIRERELERMGAAGLARIGRGY